MAKLIGMEFWGRVESSLNGMSLRRFCEINNLSYDTFKGAKVHNRLLSMTSTQKLADALGVSTDWLLNGGTSDNDPGIEKMLSFVKGNQDLQELVKLCQENPEIITNLLAMARFATGAK